jgi:uncharacterized membrane protein (Fun14 family)
MITTTDIAPFAGTVGGGFFVGLITGYAIKKVIKLVAVIIVGLFIAALAYLEYQQIVSVDWNKIQIVSQNGITWVSNAISHISNTIGASHSVSHIGIPLTSSTSAGLVLGLAKG